MGGRFRGVVDQLISVRSSRVVALARAILASFLLLSVTVGTLRYPEAQRVAKLLLAIYFAYSLLILAGLRTVRLRRHLFRAALALSIIDIVVLGGLLYLTQGLTAPFFTPLIFVILSGAIQWGSRGAILGGLLVLLLYLPSGLVIEVFEPNHRDLLQLYLVRVGYIGVITLSLAAFASNLERLISELTRLSRVPVRGGFGEIPLTDSLAYAMHVFDARRGLLVWQDSEEPYLRIVQKHGGEVQSENLWDGDQGPLVVSTLINAPFLFDRSSLAVLYRIGTQLRDFAGQPFAPILRDVACYDRVLAIPIEAGHSRGLVLILDPADPVNEDLAVAAMAAGQLSLMIESWQLHSELRVAAASDERARLARDLHDGVLQFLAGARLQLDVISRSELPDAAHTRLQQLIRSVEEEHCALRGIVNTVRQTDIGTSRLSISLDQVANHLSRSWDVSVDARVEPPGLVVSAAIEDNIVRIVREAVANAVRHGGAGKIMIEATLDLDSLDIVITDDGRGFTFCGSIAGDQLAVHPGRPRSVHDRVVGMGGAMTLTSGSSGARLNISLPLEGS